jgi:hypothetical protein
MSRSWWLGVAAASTAIFALPAGAQQPPLPGTSDVPSVTVPPVTVPPTTVPPVTVPPTPVTPTVTTPPAQTPSVTTPSVTTPSMPASVAVGSGAGGSGAAGSGAEGGGSGSGANGSGAGGSGTAANESGSGSGAASGAAGAGAGGDGPRGGSHPRSADRGSTSDRSRDEVRRDRALRHAVLAREACLARMPRSERRVLTLRAGVGRARPRTRAQVQRITGLRRARVAALERSGLQRLRSLSATGCANTAGSGTDHSTAAPATQPRPTGAQPQITVRGQRQSRTSLAAAKHVNEHPRSEGLPLLHTPDSPLDLVPIAVAFGLAVGVFVFVREARRSA